jgi:hypothetical protein
MIVWTSILAKNSEFAKWTFSQTSVPKPDCCKTYSSWILISTIQNHPCVVSSELGWLRSNGLAVMMVGTSILAQNSEFAQLNFPHTHAPKPDCCKTYSSWILISTIQNHPWVVSSELGWLRRSNGLLVLILGVKSV